MPSSDTSASRARRPAGGGSRVVPVGASGNVGTSLLRRLEDSAVGRVDHGGGASPGAVDVREDCWVAADIAEDDLVSRFAGAEAVVHLACEIQPSHDEAAMRPATRP